MNNLRVESGLCFVLHVMLYYVFSLLFRVNFYVCVIVFMLIMLAIYIIL